jgi:hypothetical protein
MRKLVLLTILSFFVGGFFLAAGANTASAAYTTLTLPTLNADIRTWTDGSAYDSLFPSTQTWNGVPFSLASPDSKGNTVFYDDTLAIPVNVYGVTNAYTIINTAYGSDGSDVGQVEFVGSAGADYIVQLVEGTNVRDHYDGYFENTIDGITALPAYNRRGFGYAGLDMQIYNLPSAFATQTLSEIIFSSNQLGYYGQPFIAAATVASNPVPIPGALLLLAPGLAGFAAIRKRFKG